MRKNYKDFLHSDNFSHNTIEIEQEFNIILSFIRKNNFIIDSQLSQLNLDGIKVEIEKIFSNNLINIENENAILFLNETLQDMVFFQSFYFDGEKLYNWIREDENDFKYLDINKIIDFINSVEIENYSTYMQKKY